MVKCSYLIVDIFKICFFIRSCYKSQLRKYLNNVLKIWYDNDPSFNKWIKILYT